jgi:membrane-associated phospholipid phosphatase
MDSSPTTVALRDISRWRPVLFVVLLMSGVLLLASWWVEGSVTRNLWDRLDRAVFFQFNGSLAEGRGWQLFWAIANARAFDLVGGMFILVVYLHYAFAQQRAYLTERLTMLVVLVVVVTLAVQLGKIFLAIGRPSPSKVLQPVIWLNQLFPDIPAKVRSGNSFPGDHTTVLMFWACFMWVFAGWRYGLLAAGGTVLLSLPRLVGGAHWLTDSIVGAGVIVLLGLPLLICTPFYAQVVGRVQPLMQWPVKILNRLFPYTPSIDRKGATG